MPRASSVFRRIQAQTLVEVKQAFRRGENLLFTMILPVLLLIFFSKVDVLSFSGDRPAVEHLMPIILALAVMSASMVGLAIATAFERKYRVLKRLGLTPLGRSGLIWAKVLAVLVVELIQVLSLIGVGALFLGWRFSGNVALVLVFLVAGTAAFAGLGLLMAGTLRAEGTLALANGMYVILLLFGGIAVPLSQLPAPAAAVAKFLPTAALVSGLSGAMWSGAFHAAALAVLVIWAAIGIGLTTFTFRWE